MFQKITFIILLLSIHLCLIAQVEKEKIIQVEIEKLGNQLNENNEAAEQKQIIKQFKKITKETRTEPKLHAIANSLIAKELTKYNLNKEAPYFLKQSRKSRNKGSELLPKRWALDALIKNSFERKDYKSALKYSKEWILITSENPKALEPIYRYNSDWYFEVELTQLLKRTHPNLYRYRYGQLFDLDDFDNRSKINQKLISFYFKNFPDYSDSILDDSKEFYKLVVSKRLNLKDGLDDAKKLTKKGLRVFKNNLDHEEYTKQILQLANLYMGNRDGISPFEKEGFKLVEKYIQANKKDENYERMAFGYRLIATRYAKMGKYKEAVQYLASALKICNEYDLENEKKKSYGGLHVILAKLKKKRDTIGLYKAQKWKDGYKTKGLNEKDIERFDEILSSLRLWK